MTDNYEKNYESLRSWLADLDVEAVYQRLGLTEPVDGCLHLDLLRRHYRIDQHAVHDEGGEGKPNVNCQSALIWYLTYGGVGEPHYKFQPLRAFTEGLVFAGNNQDGNWQASATERAFAKNEESIVQAMGILGAEPIEAGSGFDYAWRLLVLPKMPIEIRFCRSDEEFPCSIKIYPDETAMNYLPFEALAVFIGCIYGEITHIGRTLNGG
ncbi:MAG: DUF3786 domain-containing protein [Actinomycetia bacterium]|nr:DUF3786 domain-containing protein [Actinomycetes bacterium]